MLMNTLALQGCENGTEDDVVAKVKIRKLNSSCIFEKHALAATNSINIWQFPLASCVGFV